MCRGEGMIVLAIIWLHFISDFILQNDKMALNKSSSSLWLFIHSFIYGVCFFWLGLSFVMAAILSHFLIDFFTSRWTKKLWLQNKRHWFFCVVGFDQALHLTVLYLLLLSENIVC